MKILCFICIAALGWTGDSFGAQTNTVALPGKFSLRLQTVRYSTQKPSSLMGDGFAADIGVAETEDLRLFLERVVASDSSWAKGPFGPIAQEALKFLQSWMQAHQVQDAIAKACDLEALAKSETVFYRVEIRRKKTAGDLSDAWLWIIDPETRLVVFLHEAT